ncbi:hypothetical protein Tco_1115359 [Tanacetum coccineum]
MYKEYLFEFWYSAKALENSKVSFSIPTGGIFGEVGVNTFRNAIGAHYLAHFNEYVAPPSIDIVRQWFPTIGYGEEVSAKGTLRKSLLPFRLSIANGFNIDYANIFLEDIILKLKKKQRKKVVPYTRFISLLIMHKMKEGYGDDEITLYPTQQEATKGGSSKAPTGSKIGHFKKRKESSSAMDSNLSQPLVSTTVDPGMHKEDQQATGGPTSLGVTSEERSNPQLSSENDASAVSTAKVDPGNSGPSDFVPQQQGINEGTKNTSYDHLFAATGPHVLSEQTKSVSEGLDTVLTQPLRRKGANLIARHVDEEEASKTIKLDDLAKLVSNVQPSFNDLDSPEDDPIIIIESDAEEDDGIHAKTKDTSVPKSSSPKYSLIQELTNQVLILQS